MVCKHFTNANVVCLQQSFQTVYDACRHQLRGQWCCPSFAVAFKHIGVGEELHFAACCSSLYLRYSPKKRV